MDDFEKALAEAIDVDPIDESTEPPKRLDRRTHRGGFQVWVLPGHTPYPSITDEPNIQVAMRRAKEIVKMSGIKKVVIYDELGNFFAKVDTKGVVKEKRVARNPFGHALYEDAQEQLAAVVGKKGAERIFEAMDARLPVDEAKYPKMDGVTSREMRDPHGFAKKIVGQVQGAAKAINDLDSRAMGADLMIGTHLPRLLQMVQITGKVGAKIAMPVFASLLSWANSNKDAKNYARLVKALNDAEAKVKRASTMAVEESEPTGPVLDERQMEQGVRYEIVNVQPGDFGGIMKHQGELAVKVIGNTFAIKDQLKKMGFRFNGNDKTWELKHEYSSFGRAKGAKRGVVERAIKDIGPIVKAANDEIQKRNQAALAGAGVSDDPRATDPKASVKRMMSAQRLNARLKKNGIGIYYEFPHSIGGFAKGGAYVIWIVGNTFNVKDQLKRFGFRFSRQVPGEVVSKAKKDGVKRVDAGWSMDGATYDRISSQVDQTLLRSAEGTL